jgi:Fe-S oxidoreductase
MTNLSKNESNGGIHIVDDSLWNELIDLTDGAVALCYQCGVCTAVCPWGLFAGESLSIRAIIKAAQIGLLDQNSSLWLCTTCDQCSAFCPRGVDISQIIRVLRSIAWRGEQAQEGLPSLLWSIYWNNNPWSQPPSQRASWIGNVDIPIFDPNQHEILLYIGCTSSYDRRAQKIALSLVEIFEAAGVRFGYLGEAEPCCGESALSVGHLPYFYEIARKTTQIFDEHGVNDIVTVSPHCYDVFKNHYPSMNNRIAPVHYTQYLENLVLNGQLIFSTDVNRRVTFQDPCYLGRHNKIFDAPRAVIKTIPGIEFVEMTEKGVDGLCCGGGGGRMWIETEAGERFSDFRVKQALETNSSYLITACPFCVVCLEDSVKSVSGCEMQVLDLAEVVTQAL